MQFRLRSLPFAARLALTLALLTNLVGFLASGAHLKEHHHNRDERPELSMDDFRGAYHGVRSESGMRVALERGHPPELPEADRAILLAWLASDTLDTSYDDLDLGDEAPAEILGASCLECHARGADDAIGETLPLEYWDDVKRVAYSRDISPTSPEILAASTHAHAISLAAITLLVGGLMFLTSWPRALSSWLALAASAGLFVDLCAWWLARSSEVFVYAIVAGGVAYAASMGLMSVLVIVDLWRPSGE